MDHYQVPSEFIRQKTVVFWFVTVEHAIAGFGGYLLGQALGGSSPVTAICIAVGLAVTTVRFQGLVLYRFVPIGIGFVNYLGAALTIISTARWYTTRIFPLAFATGILWAFEERWSVGAAAFLITLVFVVLLAQLVMNFIQREF